MKRLSVCVALAITSHILIYGGAAFAQTTFAECAEIVSGQRSGPEKSQLALNCISLLARNKISLPRDGDNANSAPEVEPTLVSAPLGWSNYDGYAPFHYFKTPDGLVHLGGMMSGCPSQTAAILNLPEGYRPPKRLIFMTLANDDVARVDIVETGEVIYHFSRKWGYPPTADCDRTEAKRKWLSFSGISFLPAQ